MDHREGAGALSACAPVAALALVTLLLAGCTAQEVVSRVRAGDFVVLDLAAFDEDGRQVLNRSGLRAVAGPDVRARVPEGWDANATQPLPPGVVEALRGLPVGASVETPLLQPEFAYGLWSLNRTIHAPLRERLPTMVVVPRASLACEGDCASGEALWAGHAWQVEVEGLDDTTARVRIFASEGDAGRVLEVPDYWSSRYQLWKSRLVALGRESLEVEHLVEPGREAEVGGLRYRLGVRDGLAVADGNHALAGASLRFRALVRDLAFAGSDEFALAPDALLVTMEGERLSVSDLRGSSALLDFYATWCVTCKQQGPILARAHREYGDRVRIVSVSIDPLDDAGRVAAFRSDVEQRTLATWGSLYAVNWTFASDPALGAAKAFSVIVLPRHVLLDADGRIRATRVGLQPWADLRGELERLLAEDP